MNKIIFDPYQFNEWVTYFDKDSVMSASQRENFASSLSMFCQDTTLKFIKGQKEHGGDIRDRNMDDEMYAEIMDLAVYSLVKRYWSPKV